MAALTIVFVHGWSVTNVDTYGELPLRLRAEASKQGLSLDIREIFLGKYISFHNEVRLPDISRAFKTAVEDQLADIPGRFACIAHSTGGPVIRDWWDRYYADSVCPMSHLIMLAPANYGSALAQLGKERLGRIKAWFDGVEPGQGVLDWLELGSYEAWQLNKKWILSSGQQIGSEGVFPFVLTGQYIDRKLYDSLNSYTGELGSDGVVRAAAANLEGRYIKLQQPAPKMNKKGNLETRDFEIAVFKEAPKTPFRIVTNKSHSGAEMGIMKSVKKAVANDSGAEAVKAIIDCVRVSSKSDYDKVYNQFASETEVVQDNELVEMEDRLLLTDRTFIHDRFSMVVFRVVDTEGYPVRDYDLLITGEGNDPNQLPPGFFKDRQRNKISSETITYFFNFDVMQGTEAIRVNRKEIRAELPGISKLGFKIQPRPEKGFVRYLPCQIKASPNLFKKALVPNSTTLIEICLQRVAYKEVFRMDKLGKNMPTEKEGDFKDIKPGNDIAK